MKHRTFRIIVLAILLSFTVQVDACSWAVGYFHQVTRLKGKVVGKSLGPMQFRWLRRMFAVSGAALKVFEYQGQNWKADTKPLARTIANSAGEFEFAGLNEGHYSLQVNGGGLNGWFDFEITSKAAPTKNITIDVSPNFPDCTGGHEFEVQAEKN